MTIVIGIDPGVNTGLAAWDCKARKLADVQTLPIHQAMAYVGTSHSAGILDHVVFEDARQRRWFGQAGRDQLQGAGSIKRDCSVWEAFLRDLGVEFRAQAPQRGGTKWDAARFAKATGWTARTSEHGRDAALLVYGVRANARIDTPRAEEEQRSPFDVRCGACGHVWTAAYTPMEAGRLAKLLEGMCCPACGEPSKNIFLAPKKPNAQVKQQAGAPA